MLWLSFPSGPCADGRLAQQQNRPLRADIEAARAAHEARRVRGVGVPRDGHAAEAQAVDLVRAREVEPQLRRVPQVQRQPLVEVDFDAVRAAGFDPTVFVIVCERSENSTLREHASGPVTVKEPVVWLSE